MLTSTESPTTTFNLQSLSLNGEGHFHCGFSSRRLSGVRDTGIVR